MNDELPEGKSYYVMPDLTPMLQEIEAVVMRYLNLTERPAVGIAFTMQHTGYEHAHYCTNISRQEGIDLFEDTAKNMRKNLAQQN